MGSVIQGAVRESRSQDMIRQDQCADRSQMGSVIQGAVRESRSQNMIRQGQCVDQMGKWDSSMVRALRPG